MVRYLIALMGLSLMIWLASSYTGYVIVRDDTGLVKDARVIGGIRHQDLTDLPFGYFAAIPDVEGEIEVRCTDGSKVSGGYVTKHRKEMVEVTGEETCRDLIQL